MDTISTPNTANSTQRVNLSGSNYILKQRFNTRTQSWYIDVLNNSGDVLIYGSKLLLNVPLVVRNLNSMPDGNLAVYKKIGAKSTVLGRNNLGVDQDYVLCYYTLEDLT